ncbi:hypothetical protein [Streptomyces sp. NPDC012510]|uniref:hypothetical protein n=1 Tax=Streptomyces sp. NPDC012510 TaxID=3364838 RepID=UPI0036E0441E
MVLYASPHWRCLAMSSDEEEFRAFHSEFTRRLPNESPLRTTPKPWFIQQLRTIAHAIQDAAEQNALAGDDARHNSKPVGSEQ